MNVLLAEANVPYDQLYEMDDINGEFDNTDGVAHHRRPTMSSTPPHVTIPPVPIYGMPILNVDHSRNVIVLKRSMRPRLLRRAKTNSSSTTTRRCFSATLKTRLSRWTQ